MSMAVERGSLRGWGSGLVGVVIFAGSLPATRVAVEGFTPLFLTAARAAIAAFLAIALLAILRQRRPARGDIASLGVVALGVVVGFPLLTALALQYVTAAHSIVFIGLLPLATAIFGTLRGGERPRPAFWLFSGLGSALVSGFAFRASGPASLEGDLLMLAAILVCGLGYAEGARLSRRLGGWQVISWALVLSLPAILVCGLGYAEGARLSRRLGGWQVISWALVLSLPVMAALALATLPASFDGVPPAAWASLAYVSVFSMLVGFIFWYRGLALGGIAGVGQLQLLQPFIGLALAGILLGERVEPAMIAATLAVVLCVAGARRFS